MDEVAVYRFEPDPPLPPSGVDEGWLVLWSGKPGEAQAMRVARIHEGDGSFHVVPNGEFEDVTVTAD